MTSRRQDFLSTAVEQLRYHVQKLESAATHMMAACDTLVAIRITLPFTFIGHREEALHKIVNI